MGIVLYDNPASSNAMKVRFLLAELGLPYERRHVPLAQPRPDWYRARYPFGTVPFFEDGDLELGESNAILRYLANREGRTDLYPAEPAARAAVDWALDAWSTQFRGALFPAERIGLMAKPIDDGGSRPEDADPAELAAAIDAARPKFDIMESFVADNGTVVGDVHARRHRVRAGAVALVPPAGLVRGLAEGGAAARDGHGPAGVLGDGADGVIPEPVRRRDLVGYGRTPPRFAWPEGAGVVVNLVLVYEEGSEYSVLWGDDRNDGWGEYADPGVQPPHRDPGTESHYEYGSRAGVWRLARIFDAAGVPVTISAAAVALELNPDVAQWMREHDHDLLGHGWRWNEPWTMSREEERTTIARAVETYERVLGRRSGGVELALVAE